ncbi:MAG: hypothetical protein A4E47_01628 [Methanosaeta sp. PtaU1.Bin028]|nr:MAG: hypothetical protein A4E47_01628 [Methanosaeta sp. PtaU1.Bin028]
MNIFTIGHSNRALSELVDALLAFRVEVLADVRSLPRSRANFQFNQDILERELAQVAIAYRWMGPGLGGYRKSSGGGEDNSGWETPAFRGYADYALTDGFRLALQELVSLAKERSTAIMCAELMYTSCHRRIISDYLAAHGWNVVHILDSQRSIPHRMTPFARVKSARITYPRRYEVSTLEDFIEDEGGK